MQKAEWMANEKKSFPRVDRSCLHAYRAPPRRHPSEVYKILCISYWFFVFVHVQIIGFKVKSELLVHKTHFHSWKPTLSVRATFVTIASNRYRHKCTMSKCRVRCRNGCCVHVNVPSRLRWPHQIHGEYGLCVSLCLSPTLLKKCPFERNGKKRTRRMVE